MDRRAFFGSVGAMAALGAVTANRASGDHNVSGGEGLLSNVLFLNPMLDRPRWNRDSVTPGCGIILKVEGPQEIDRDNPSPYSVGVYLEYSRDDGQTWAKLPVTPDSLSAPYRSRITGGVHDWAVFGHRFALASFFIPDHVRWLREGEVRLRFTVRFLVQDGGGWSVVDRLTKVLFTTTTFITSTPVPQAPPEPPGRWSRGVTVGPDPWRVFSSGDGRELKPSYK